MQIELVAAVSQNNVIGHRGELLWHLPADLEFFENYIRNDWLLTGRTSYESAQGAGIFKDRTDVILLTRNPSYTIPGLHVVHSIPEAIATARAQNAKKLLVLGGGVVYRETIDLADKLIITRIHHSFEGDTHFPFIDPTRWKTTSEIHHSKDQDNPYDYSFLVFERK